jgi:hypothetical protein
MEMIDDRTVVMRHAGIPLTTHPLRLPSPGISSLTPPLKSDAYSSVLRTVLFIADGHEAFLFSIWMFCHCYYANMLKPLLVIHLRLFNRCFLAAFLTKRRKNGHSASLCLSVRITTQLLNVFSQNLILGSYVCTSHFLLKFGQQQTITLQADLRPLLCPSGA